MALLPGIIVFRTGVKHTLLTPHRLDSLDGHGTLSISSVSLTISQLAKQFDKTNAEIAWGITLVLMLRSVGSAIFGVAANRYSRKWPFIVNNALFIVFELATGFTNKYSSFLTCQALSNIAMGGLYGNAAATAIEDCPPAARGIISGMF
jgi:SHS family lactate transporter-like MFS transporter